MFSFSLQANEDIKFSVANTDGIFSTMVNPAALGFGNAGGVGYVQYFSEDKFEKEHYDFIINFENLGYSYSHSNDNYLHRIALGSRLGDTNLYLGSDYEWTDKADAFNSSLLFRPWDFLSIGSLWKNSFKSDQSLKLGFSLRPLGYISDFWTGLTFSYDRAYSESDWSKGVLSVELEPAAGFKFSFHNDFQNEEYSADFSFSFSHFKIGSNYNKNGDSDGFSYVNISKKRFKNCLSTSEQNKFYNYKLKGEVVDQKPTRKIGPFRIVSSQGRSLSEILRTIRELKNNKEIKGIVFKSGNISTNRASFHEIQDALTDFKKSDKKIIYYFENTTKYELYSCRISSR